MRRKLIGLAVAGAMAAPLAAQAQQGSTVQIYGLLQPSIDFVDNGDDSGTNMSNNNSRLGFRGSEDLGGGLKAIFQLESAVDFDNRSGTGWTRRDSWVGLAGGFGSVTLGTQFTAYKRSTDFLDPFADTIGDYNNVFGVPAFDQDGFNDRFTNSVHWTSPNWGGFQLMATYGLNGDGDGDLHEEDSGDGKDDAFSIALTYKLGGLTLVAAYEDQEDRLEVDLGGGAGFALESAKSYKIGAGYKLGNTTFGLMYAKEDFGSVSGAAGAVPVVDGDDLERDLIFASIKHSIGNVDLMASYTWADDFDDVSDSGAQAFAIGAAYNFSKRTNIGAYFTMVDNDDNVAYGLDAGHAPSGAGEKVKAFSVRMRHAF